MRSTTANDVNRPIPTRRSLLTTATVVGALQLLGLVLIPFSGSFGAEVPHGLGWLLPLLFLLMVGFCLLCAIAGIALLRGHPRGRRLALLSLLPQLVMIQTPGFVYSVANGGYCAVTTDGATFSLQAAWGGGLSALIGSIGAGHGNQQLFGINILPLLLIIILYWNAPLVADMPA